MSRAPLSLEPITRRQPPSPTPLAEHSKPFPIMDAFSSRYLAENKQKTQHSNLYNHVTRRRQTSHPLELGVWLLIEIAGFQNRKVLTEEPWYLYIVPGTGVLCRCTERRLTQSTNSFCMDGRAATSLTSFSSTALMCVTPFPYERRTSSPISMWSKSRRHDVSNSASPANLCAPGSSMTHAVGLAEGVSVSQPWSLSKRSSNVSVALT